MVVEEKGVASSGLAPQVLVYSLQVPWTLDTRSYAGGVPARKQTGLLVRRTHIRTRKHAHSY